MKRFQTTLMAVGIVLVAGSFWLLIGVALALAQAQEYAR